MSWIIKIMKSPHILLYLTLSLFLEANAQKSLYDQDIQLDLLMEFTDDNPGPTDADGRPHLIRKDKSRNQYVIDLSKDFVMRSGNIPKAFLFVNVASQCEAAEVTYPKLVDWHTRYGNDGLKIIALPSHQFNDEHGSETEIMKHAYVNNKVEFLLGKAINVKGKKSHPLFKWLVKPMNRLEYEEKNVVGITKDLNKESSSSSSSSDLKSRLSESNTEYVNKRKKYVDKVQSSWYKFLVDGRTGKVISSYDDDVENLKVLEKDIEKVIKGDVIKPLKSKFKKNKKMEL